MTSNRLNCALRFSQRVSEHPHRSALYSIERGRTSFGELESKVLQSQRLLHHCGVECGTPVLIAASPSPELYAFLIAALAIGAPVLFIEPWLPLQEINQVIRDLKPQVFFSGRLGQLWGLRSSEVRSIPHWTQPQDLAHFSSIRTQPRGIHVELLEKDHPAMIAFSSGTTGKPKGSIRTQSYLWRMHDLILQAHPKWTDPNSGSSSPDLVTFPNVALFNLGLGRPSVFSPTSRDSSKLNKLSELPSELRPKSTTCGPAFLKLLLQTPGFHSIRDFSVGGALTDCWIFEEAFVRWSEASFLHVYGGSEAEPVTLGDARNSVKLSANRGLFQTLALGKPFEPIQYSLDKNKTLWVSGPNVSEKYWGTPDDLAELKRTDSEGRVWHCMGDRIQLDHDSWWYEGRAFQKPSDFILEQKVYSQIQSSAAFVHRDENDRITLICDRKLIRHQKMLLRTFPELSNVIPTQITRDRRHQARIDRRRSLPFGLTTKNFRRTV